MTEPTSAQQYDDRGTEATRRVLLDLAHVLSTYFDRLVVIGGIVPTLLLEGADMPHVGTLDIDLTLDAEALREDDEYARMIELLEASGYVRSVAQAAPTLRPFQLLRRVDLQDGGLEVDVIIDLLMPRGTQLTKHRPPLIDALRVQEIDGGRLALDQTVRYQISGRTPEGWTDSAHLRVISLPAFLALKGNALKRRRKNKDAYDVYYVIRNDPRGLDVLAEACRALLPDPLARDAFQQIADKFATAESYGPGTVGLFLQGRLPPGFTEAQVRIDAFRQVSTWARKLGLQPNDHGEETFG